MSARPRPASITLSRVLLVISGFVCVVTGIIELGPETGALTKVIGVVLILLGVVTWLLVWRMRRPTPNVFGLLVGLVVVSVVVRGAQFVLFGSPVMLITLALPLFVLWRLEARSAKEWNGMTDAAGDGRRGIRPTGARRVVAAVTAVTVTAAALVVVTGVGVATAVVPCDFPAPASVVAPATASDAKPSGTVTATDGVKLAYFEYAATDPVATLVFYHGAGAHSTAGYLGLGRTLADRYGITTYLVDMRGHGASGGPAGDSPSTVQLFADVKTVVDYVKEKNPALPEFVGGHSAGAGLVLNSQPLISSRVAGYAFLAPDFGLHSGAQTAEVSSVCERPLIADDLTNGVLDAHADAVSFGYTPQQVSAAGLVDRYAATVAIAQDADDSATVLEGIRKPVGVWIGSRDEVFDPAKVVAYTKKYDKKATAAQVPVADHLGIIDRGADALGAWVRRQAA